jgi:hypothetical protein
MPLDGCEGHDPSIDRWLRESVVPVFDRVAAGTEKLIDANEVFSGLQARYRARKETLAAEHPIGLRIPYTGRSLDLAFD